MEKVLDMGKNSAVGSFHLFWGTVVSTVIMAVGTIVFVRMMSPDEYGLYSLALVPVLTADLFRDWGISTAATKYIAQFRASGEVENVKDVVTAVLIFQITVGSVLSLVSFLAASHVASVVFNRPELSSLISIISIAIFSNALLASSQSSFVGFEKMKFNSLTMICQAIVKSTVTPLLVFLGYGALGAAFGYTFSYLIPGILALALLYLYTLRRYFKGCKANRSRVLRTVKKLLHYGIPLSLASLLLGFMTQFSSFMMGSYCSNLMIGNYQSAIQFAILLTFFSFPLSTVLFPAFAKLSAEGEQESLRTVFTSSVKYTALLLVPATMAIMVLSKSLIGTIFGDKWLYAPYFLTLYVIGSLFSLVGNLSMNSYLTGRGETKFILKQSLLTLSFNIPLALTLIPHYGVLGVIMGNVISGLPSMFWGLNRIWKKYHLRADFNSSARIFITSTTSSLITYLALGFFVAPDWIKLVVGGFVFFSTYIVGVSLIGAITETDLANLKDMFSGLGIVSRILNLFLDLIKRVVQVRK
jgi:O-antigen/teichoic acid export membrane protein